MEGINVSQISMQAGLIKNWHTFRSLLLSLVSTIPLNLIDHPKIERWTNSDWAGYIPFCI